MKSKKLIKRQPRKKYKSCTAPIGEFCNKHQCVHKPTADYEDEIKILKADKEEYRNFCKNYEEWEGENPLKPIRKREKISFIARGGDGKNKKVIVYNKPKPSQAIASMKGALKEVSFITVLRRNWKHQREMARDRVELSRQMKAGMLEAKMNDLGYEKDTEKGGWKKKK